MKIITRPIVNLWKRLTTRTYTLLIYMKSGNVIELDRIADYEFGWRGNEVISIALKWSGNPRFKPLVKTIAMDQIEAIVRVR